MLLRSSFRRRLDQRVADVERAAAEAAQHDAAFEPASVRAAAEQLVAALGSAWASRDLNALRPLLGADLAVEWERRLKSERWKGTSGAWKPPSEALNAGKAQVEYVGLSNRGPGAACVVVRVDPPGEWWTLGRADAGWTLLSVEAPKEGRHHLEAALISAPWQDTERLRAEAVVESAQDDRVDDAQLADLTKFEGDARAAALDLSLVDGRFAPDVLAVAVQRAVGAWVEAIDGDDAALAAVAAGGALRDLLYADAGAHTRRVVRGPRVLAVRIANLDPTAVPPTMSVDVDVRGRRYVQHRFSGRVVAGSAKREATFTEHWTLALTGDAAMPWRITDATSPPRES